MKKALLLAASVLFLLTSCKLDNYEGPNARVFGRILDAKTGELVGTDIQQGSQLMVYEQGYAAAETHSNGQTWVIQNTGEYRNNLVFAARYEVIFQNGNFYGFTDFMDVKTGDNEIDWKVTPYLRVKDCTIDKSGNTVTAKFKLEGGKGDETVSEVRLFAFSDIWVGNYVKFALTGGTDVQKPNEVVDPTKEYTLTIDVSQNSSFFKYTGKNYYFRVGAKASVPGAGTIRHNYSELKKIAF
ncbi:MAG: DUF3823 domain-containing protein [Bacteroidales bacterium]|jgi:hypothetical protein|nr:DUF3823 domain-containing protein [Bacteroidales bacterium]